MPKRKSKTNALAARLFLAAARALSRAAPTSRHALALILPRAYHTGTQIGSSAQRPLGSRRATLAPAGASATSWRLGSAATLTWTLADAAVAERAWQRRVALPRSARQHLLQLANAQRLLWLRQPRGAPFSVSNIVAARRSLHSWFARLNARASNIS